MRGEKISVIKWKIIWQTKKKMKKAFIAFLLQLPLIVLTKDVALGETNNRDSKAQIELAAAGAKQVNSTESTTPLTLSDNSTIWGVDKNSTESINGTEALTTTTPDPQQLLIPPATVEAQIVKANISTPKPSRLQAAT